LFIKNISNGIKIITIKWYNRGLNGHLLWDVLIRVEKINY
jgi:hypothetical protein